MGLQRKQSDPGTLSLEETRLLSEALPEGDQPQAARWSSMCRPAVTLFLLGAF